MRAPTGQQYSIRLGNVEATITQLAAGIRELRVGGVEIAEPFAASSTPPMGCGIVLVPWPNRIRDGVWTLNGTKQQLDLTDPGYKQATHGLLRNTAYEVIGHTESAITLGATVHPQHGYPFLLDTSVHYELTETGMDVAHTITNVGSSKAPVAVGAHPYFRIGDVPTAALDLRIAAGTRFELDEKLLPTTEHPVDGDFDLRDGKALGDIDLNVTLGELPAGTTTSVLTAPDGRAVEVWQDENFRFVQVYTPRNFPGIGGQRHAVAIEPMTAAPDAFNSGRGLHWVEPGDSWVVRWGVRYSA